MTRDNPDRVKPWTLTQLACELHKDLKQCTTKTERLNCISLATIEIRELATEILQSRKFTPSECAVIEQFGINCYP